jgi:hypothetical protein
MNKNVHRHCMYFVIGLFAEHESGSQASSSYLEHL